MRRLTTSLDLPTTLPLPLHGHEPIQQQKPHDYLNVVSKTVNLGSPLSSSPSLLSKPDYDLSVRDTSRLTSTESELARAKEFYSNKTPEHSNKASGVSRCDT